jgi:hypothetical protein
MNLRLAACVALCASVLGTACLAPMCRTTEIPDGFRLSLEPGATVFKSTGFVPDTAHLFRNRSVPLTCVGFQADLRAGYGFTDWLGADLTAGLSAGSILNRPESLHSAVTASYRIAAAALFRPWQHNSMMFAEFQMPYAWSLGWASGFPLYGPERWNVMAEFGAVPFFVAQHGEEVGWRDFAPEILQIAVRRNFALGRATLAPTLGGTVWWSWEDRTAELGSATLGLIWAPPPFGRRAAAEGYGAR